MKKKRTGEGSLFRCSTEPCCAGRAQGPRSVLLALLLFALLLLTIVAIDAVHWPAAWSSLAELWQGYAITDKGFGNYKLPLLFLLMLVPLVLNGAGRLSLDHLFLKLRRNRDANPAG